MPRMVHGIHGTGVNRINTRRKLGESQARRRKDADFDKKGRRDTDDWR
jgi:hypothetical protein